MLLHGHLLDTPSCRRSVESDGRTRSEDLREDALLVAAVDVVWRLSGLIGSVQQAPVFGVSEEELGQAATPPTDSDVEGRVSFLGKQEVQK